MELKRVVVTGIGALSPLGNTAPETWENVKKGKSGAGPITHFDSSLFKTHFACEVKGFDGRNFIDRKSCNKMDLYSQYAVVAAQQAVGDCGIDLETANKDRIGVIFGVGIGGIHTFEEEVEVDIKVIHDEIVDLKKQLSDTEEKMDAYLKTLNLI